MDQINWGIIGCGDVTEVKSGPAYNKVPGSKLVAVMRRNAEKAADYASRHGVGQWYSDADKMMDEAGINSVSIATPPSSHLSYAIDALERGLNVYVEKPVTRNSAEAQQMADVVKQYNGKLTVAHYRRALPMFLYVKELIDNNTIGDIRTVQIRMWKGPKLDLIAKTEDNWRVQPEVSGGGYFHDLAPHQLDLMLFYFGEPDYYKGISLNQSGATPSDDHVSGQIIFKNKVVVDGSWCFNVAESEATDLCEMVGTKGKITFPFFSNYYVKVNTDEGDETVDFIPPVNIQHPMIAKVVDYFRGDAPNPCPIEDAVTLMRIIDAFTIK